jgi:hypothetical protein
METFLIRVWFSSEPPEPATAGPLHGLAEHVRSGLATAFTDGEQLCAWLGAMALEQGGAAVRSARVAAEGDS